jgi:hypothetical protein
MVTLNAFIPETTAASVFICVCYILFLHRKLIYLHKETQLNVEFIEKQQKDIKQLGDNQANLLKFANELRMRLNKLSSAKIKENKAVDSNQEN